MPDWNCFCDGATFAVRYTIAIASVVGCTMLMNGLTLAWLYIGAFDYAVRSV